MEGLEENRLSSNELCGGFLYQQRAQSPNESRPGLGVWEEEEEGENRLLWAPFIIDLPKEERAFKKTSEVGRGEENNPQEHNTGDVLQNQTSRPGTAGMAESRGGLMSPPRPSQLQPLWWGRTWRLQREPPTGSHSLEQLMAGMDQEMLL